MPTARAQRQVAADPVSTALLLTGSSAWEWWPGLRVTGRDRDRLLGELPDTSGAAPLRLSTLPPRRTPTSFLVGFRVEAPGRVTTGTVRLAARAGGTLATLELDSPLSGLERAAERFLAAMARAAESRSRVA